MLQDTFDVVVLILGALIKVYPNSLTCSLEFDCFNVDYTNFTNRFFLFPTDALRKKFSFLISTF